MRRSSPAWPTRSATVITKPSSASSAASGRATKEALTLPMRRAGIERSADPATIAEAEALAEALADVSWESFLSSFEPITTQYLAMYRRIGELNPAEQATVDVLIAHELALREFGRLELTGRGERSLDAVWALGRLA